MLMGIASATEALLCSGRHNNQDQHYQVGTEYICTTRVAWEVHLLGLEGVQARGGLVAEEQPRAAQQLHADTQALAFPAFQVFTRFIRV